MRGQKRTLKFSAFPSVFPENTIDFNIGAIGDDASEVTLLEEGFSEWDAKQNVEVEKLKEQLELLKRINRENLDNIKLYRAQISKDQAKIAALEKTVSQMKENRFIPLDSEQFDNSRHMFLNLFNF